MTGRSMALSSSMLASLASASSPYDWAASTMTEAGVPLRDAGHATRISFMGT